MLTSKSSLGLSLAVFCLLAFFLVLPVHAAPGSRVVISQVYGGGGNSGATYKNDFIELFNAGTADQDLTGWSVQYASAGGTATFTAGNTHALSGTIKAGQYFLIKEAAGNGGTVDLPTADLSGSLALGASAGKVALVNVPTPLPGCSNAAIVDFVGFGASSCSEGSPTATLGNALAAIRADVCDDTGNNSADFTVGAPMPRNSATPAGVCGTTPRGKGAALPASVTRGDTALLTVLVKPATLPPSTGVTVTADLTSILGSAAETLYDDGSNGDATAGDNTYSLLTTVDVRTLVGVKSLTATIADAEGRSVPVTISLTVTAPTTTHVIHDIRDNLDTLLGASVNTSGVVTARRADGFYIQEKNGTYAGTSLAIFVYTGTPVPATAIVGNELDVTGTVATYPATGTPTELELKSVTVNSTLSVGNELPAAIAIVPDSTLPQAYQFEQYSGMLAGISNTQVVGPTNSGALYVTQATVARPFREPGVQEGVILPDFSPENIPVFDGNPEVLRVDMGGCTTKPDLAVGDNAGDLVGPLGYYYSSTYGGSYSLFACPTATNTAKTAVPISAPLENEFTVASFNMWNFTGTATQVSKASQEIVKILNMPDIIGVEEVESEAALQAVADKVNLDAVAAGKNDPKYQAKLGAVSGSQNIGFLYRSERVKNPTFTVLADSSKMAAPCGSYSLWDRQPFQMDATITLREAAPYPVTVVVNHLRSLIDVDTVDTNGSVTGSCARLKRALEAEALAGILSGLQSGKNLITLGDFNAFDFSDGYVDVMGTIIGAPAPDDQVVVATKDWIDPNLTDLVVTDWANPTLYTYVENGSAQSIDHIVVNDPVLALPHRVEVAHVNADFPYNMNSDATRPERVSDHDQPVAYFAIPEVEKPTLTVKVNDVSRAYGAENPTFTGTIDGAVDGDTFTLTFSTTADATSGVGTYPITATIQDPGSVIGYYEVKNPVGTLTITAAPLTVQGNDVSRVYGAANPTFTGSVTGLQNGDVITATFDSSATELTGVGNYPITATIADPDNKLVNYNLTNTPGKLTISKANITITAPTVSKLYGAPIPAFLGVVEGMVNSDDISVDFTTTATAASGVGSYPITATIIDPTNKVGNYNVSDTPGTLTIDKAPLSITANNSSRPVGVSNPVFSGVIVGEVAGDGITATYTSAATITSPVGTYPIVPSLDANPKSDNYSVVLVNGTLTVTPASSQVSLGVSANSTIAGSPVTFTASLAGATGSVTFKDNGTTIGTAAFNGSGNATLTISSLTVGSHSVTAEYPGDANLAASTSNAVAVTVSAFPAPVVSSFNQSVVKSGAGAFTLKVYGSNFTATSTVNWNGTAKATTYVSPTELNAAITAADIATVGVSSVTVSNTVPTPGTSNGFKFAVDTAAGAPGAVTVTTVPTVTVAHGSSATVTFTFTGASTDSTATAACYNMPTGATCTYNHTTKVGTITTAAGTPTGTYPILVVFSVSNKTLTAMQTTGRVVLWSFAMLPVGFMLMGGASQRKRRWLILLALVVVLLSMVGCGGSASSTVPPPAGQNVSVQSSVAINMVVN